MPDREPTQIPQHFVFALVEDFSHMAFSCAVDPLRIANLISEKELYTWSFASLDGKTATSSNGIAKLLLAHCETLATVGSCRHFGGVIGPEVERISAGVAV